MFPWLILRVALREAMAMLHTVGVAVRADSDGSLRLVATTTHVDGRPGPICQAKQVGPAIEGEWTGWHLLGVPGQGCLQAGPAVARGPGLPVAVVGSDGGVWFSEQETPGTDTWIPPVSLGRPGGQAVISEPLGALPAEATPALVADRNGSLWVFVVRKNHAVWYRRQAPTGAGAWSDWSSLGRPGAGTNGPVIAKTLPDSRLMIFAVDTDGVVWSRSQDQQGDWDRRWFSHATSATQRPVIHLAVSRSEHDRTGPELFVVRGNGAVAHRRQLEPDGDWSDWHSLGKPSGAQPVQVAVGDRVDGRRVLFALTSSPRTGQVTGLWRREQGTPHGAWNPWAALPTDLIFSFSGRGELEDPVVVQDGLGRLVLFIRMPTKLGLHRIQSPPTGGWGFDWEELQPPPGIEP